MSKETVETMETEIIRVAQEVYTQKDFYDKEETNRLINKALKESTNYTDLNIRECDRRARREEKMIHKSNIIARFSVIMMSISFLIFLLCESTIKTSTMYSKVFIIIFIVIGVVFLIGSLLGLIITEQIKNAFYKPTFTIYYYNGTTTLKYITKATNASNAIRRFYKLTNLKYEPYRVVDDEGILYENNGKISKRTKPVSNYIEEDI